MTIVARWIRVFTVAGLVALAWAPSAAQAVPVTMSSLASGGSLTCGDKRFNAFTYTASGDMPTAGAVLVDCTTLAGNVGLVFTGAFQDVNGFGSDALITYTVTVLDPTKLITDAHLEGDPSVTGGDGTIAVTETFLPGALNQMDIGQCTAPLCDPPFLQTSDSTDFATGVTTLDVQKDIFALSLGGVVSLSTIYQTYSQVSIPEPGTLLLLGTGLLGLFGCAWRRRTR